MSMDENDLVDRVFMRIVATDTDEQFEAALSKFLPALILKLVSPSEDVRKKVMELLAHVNKRLKSRASIQLPLDQLIAQYKEPANPPMITNFSIIYIKMGYPRLTAAQKAALVPDVISLLPNKPVAQQESLFLLIVPALGDLVYPSAVETRKSLYGFFNAPETRERFLDFLLDMLLLPYSAFFPAPDGPDTVDKPQAPPCFSEVSYKRAIGEGHPGPEKLEQMKTGVVRFLCAEIFSPKEVAAHLIIASADTRHTIATAGDNELRRISSDIDWEDNALITRLMAMYLGTIINKKTQPQQFKKELMCVAAPTRIRVKLFPFFLKSKAAASLFPQNIQVVFESLFGQTTNAKLQGSGVQFIWNMAEFAPESQLKPICAMLLNCLLKLVDDASSTSDVKISAYRAIGKLVCKQSHMIVDSSTVIKDLFDRLMKEQMPDVKSGIQDALLAIAPALMKAKQDVKKEVELILSTGIESDDSMVRRVCVNVAHYGFHTCWVPTRYLLLIACSDPVEDIRSESSKLLHTKKQVELPATEYNFDLDLYPRFEEITVYLEMKQNQRLSEKKTVSRGTSVLMYKPLTLQKMADYLRICLAVSARVENPEAKDIDDWKSQSPKIARWLHKEEETVTDGSAQPPKQQKLAVGDEGISKAAVNFYASLLVSCIDLQATPSNVYLLLELLSTSPKLAQEFSSRIPWCKSLIGHHDPVVQSLASQILARVLTTSADQLAIQTVMRDTLDRFKQKLTLEQENGALFTLASLITMYKRQEGGVAESSLSAEFVRLMVPLLSNNGRLAIACQLLSEVSIAGKLNIPYGSEDNMDGELSGFAIVVDLCEKVKSPKLESKQREKLAMCLGSLGVGDPLFPWRRRCLDGLFACSTSKEVELHFSVGEALVLNAQALDSPERRDSWTVLEQEFWDSHIISGPNEMEYLLSNILHKYIVHVNTHIKQAACIWLLTVVKRCGRFKEIVKHARDIQAAFLRLLTDNDELTQDIASKGLGVVYDTSPESERKELISNLVETLMTGKSKGSGEVGEDTKLFSEGAIGNTPEGQGLSTYRELCAIATDLNQPDLVYKFLHLANHQAVWNSRKGAAFGFSMIAAQAGEQLAPYMSKIVPRLFRYTFDPNVKIQTAMRSIWNAVVKENKQTVDKYAKEIMEDLLENLPNNHWRVRESCCLAVNDLIRGRNVDDLIEYLPRLWHIIFKLLDDIKESTRKAATTTATTLSKLSIRLCDVSYGKVGERALSLILPCILTEGITSSVTEVRQLSLDTTVAMSKNAGPFLRPHVPVLVPVLLESLSGLEPQYLNYVALRVSGSEEAQQRLDRARIAASKASPMMDSINLCVQQVDGEVLTELAPRLTDLLKNSIGLGTKVGVANVIVSLCLQCGQETMQPYAGKFLAALLHGLSDRNATVRKTYASAIGNVCKIAKSTSVERLLEKLHQWYMEKDDEALHEACAYTLKAMADSCPDTLTEHKTQALPLVFLAMHKVPKHGEKDAENIWKEVWNEVTVGMQSTVRLYIQELVSVTDVALQSSSWHMKAQAAAAMSTIATSLGAEMDVKHVNQILGALLVGLTGRTWNGKESLLSALSEVVSTCKLSITSEGSPVNSDEIVAAALREAKKESLSYKMHAVQCLGKVLDALDADQFNEVWGVVHPLIYSDKPDAQEQKDEGSQKLMLELRTVGFDAIGRSWPRSSNGTHAKHIQEVVPVLLERASRVTWREQQALWGALNAVVSRTNLALMATETWISSTLIPSVVKEALACCKENKYSAVRLQCASTLLHLVTQVKDVLPEADRSELLALVSSNGSSDDNLEVRAKFSQLSNVLNGA